MKVISLFSGAGGMDLGFLLAGHEIVWSNDLDNNAMKTYCNNICNVKEHISITKDICDLLDEYSETNEGINGKIPDADIVIGGFPCQGFSIANVNRNMNDERNFLYLEVIRIIKAKKPMFVVLENVKGLENMEEGKVLEMIIDDIENACSEKYEVVYNVLNAYNYGVPQNRERIIILAVRKDILGKYTLPIFEKINGKKILNIPITHSSDSTKKDPLLPHEKTKYLYELWKKNNLDSRKEYFNSNEIYSLPTIRDAIVDLPYEFDLNIPNHNGSKCKVKISSRVGNRPTFWDKYSPTIMGRGSGTGGPLIIPHPEQHRRMSVREVARIQTFPDNFIFYGSNSAQYRQIGNAVPVLMAYHIAKIIPIKL